MGMIPPYEQIVRLSDEELISRYNALATHTTVGTSFYIEELARRQTLRDSARMLQLTVSITTLTRSIFALTIVNVLVVVVQLIVSLV